MLLRPRSMAVPKDVDCPQCGAPIFRKGERAEITLNDLYDERVRLAQLVCVCGDCGCPALIGYMPASAFGVS